MIDAQQMNFITPSKVQSWKDLALETMTDVNERENLSNQPGLLIGVQTITSSNSAAYDYDQCSGKEINKQELSLIAGQLINYEVETVKDLSNANHRYSEKEESYEEDFQSEKTVRHEFSMNDSILLEGKKSVLVDLGECLKNEESSSVIEERSSLQEQQEANS